MPRRRSVWLAWSLLYLFSATCAYGQQVTVTAPFHSVSDSFSERIGVSFGGSYKGIGFSFRGPQSGFGGSGLDPSAGGSINIPFGGRNFSGGLGISAAQGSMRSLSTVAPILTLQNGVPGVVGSGVVVPFVTQLNPVVSSGSGMFQPQSMSIARGRLENGDVQLRSEQRGQAAVAFDQPPPKPRASARISRSASEAESPTPLQRDEFLARMSQYTTTSHIARSPSDPGEAEPQGTAEVASDLFRRGQKAHEAGKHTVARLFYQMALRRGDVELQKQVRERLDALDHAR